MIANSKLVYGLIKLLNMLSPKRISKYLKYFLLALSLFTRNTVFLAVSLIFMLHSESMKDFRVKLSWIILHADMLVVDAWRLTDMILHKSYIHFYIDYFYSLQSKLLVISAFVFFDLLSSYS
jgi:hypothetical protein